MAKKKKKKKNTSRLRLLRLTIAITLIGALISAIMFFWIDAEVVKSLSNRRDSPLSAVYASPVKITNLDGITKQSLIKHLSHRNYRETNELPRLPGEYLINNENAQIFVREYKWANNQASPEQLIRISFENDKIFEITDSKGHNTILKLEPVIVASLSESQFRASNFKKLELIPEHMKNAIIAVEDERFFKHAGIDPQAIFRAALANVISMEFVQGGSTLTQQLAKNILFSPEKTFGRKLMEVFAAFSLERRLTKEQILEMYLNEIYLGQEGSFAIHGVSEACRTFFGKKIEDISVAEAAMLAGIIRAPSSYSPRRHPERALKRKDLALEKMRELGYLTDLQLQTSKNQKIVIITEARNKRSAPFFVAALESELTQHFNIEAAQQSGINIYTGLHSDMQICAETALSDGLTEIEKKYPKLKRKDSPIEGGLVAIEPQSGLIRAWAGGRDFSENQFNHVSQAIRQIGSTVKPFLYLTALDSSLNTYKTATTTSILSDEPVQIDQANQKTWEPENYDRTFHGDVTLRYALENSLNLPAVYVAQKVGINNFSMALEKFRIADKVLPVPALALGATDTTLLRLTGAYAALANGGIYVEPRLFITTEGPDGKLLAQKQVFEERVANEAPVYILTDILKGVVERGTANGVRKLGFYPPAAGKTGTSNDTRDAWFVGFTPNLSAGVWVGFDDNKKLGLTGGALAVPIWTKFMQCISSYRPPMDFIPPAGITTVDIDSHTLERAGPGCPNENVVREIYIKGTEPKKICSKHNDLGSDTGENEEIFQNDNSQTHRPKKRERSFWERIFE